MSHESSADGQHVTGVIDWPRRLDHMQQHTGQHILSAAFDRLAGVRTVSFHMGADTSTIHRFYSHLSDNAKLLRAAANKVVIKADFLIMGI